MSLGFSGFIAGNGRLRAAPQAKARLTARGYEQGLQTAHLCSATDDNASNHFKIHGEHWQGGDHTDKLRGTCNDAMDDFNRTDYDRFFDSNLECVIEWVIADDTTDVSPEDTALLGLGSDPSYRWWRPDARKPLPA